MLKTVHYKTQILELFSQGKSTLEIQKLLGFKYIQPVYNMLYKNNVFEKRGIKCKRSYSVNTSYFNSIDSEEKAYIIGFIAADGHVENNRIKISLAEKDKEILEKILKEINSNTPIKETIRNNPYQKSQKKFLKLVTISINSTALVKPLIEIGLLGNKTHALDHKLIDHIPTHLIRHFLRGYFDGDGNVLYGKRYNSGIKYNINICGNKDFLESTFQKYFPSSNKMYYEKKSKQTYIWKLSSKENVDKFLLYLYKDSKIYLKRKHIVYEYAHLKSDKLLENQEIDNQQPIISLND